MEGGMNVRTSLMGNKCGEKPKMLRISRQPSSIQIMVEKKKQMENVEYFNCFVSMKTNYANFVESS